MSEPQSTYSLEAEQSVLGGLIIENHRWDDITHDLSAQDFFCSAHRVIFNAIAKLVSRDHPFDLITLNEQLISQNNLEAVGGFAYLAELSKNTPSAANIKAYASIVVEKSRLRQLQQLGKALYKDAVSLEADFKTITEQVESKLFTLSESGTKHLHHEVSVLTALDNLIGHLEVVNGGNGVTGTPTGFCELDLMTCGLQPGDLALLAARPAMGKTALALAACLGALRASPDKSTLIFSIEMPTEQLIMRLVSMESRVELSRLRSGELEDEDWARISQAMSDFAQWNNKLIIDDNSFQTPSLLRSRARRYVRKYGQPSLIIIDYLQLMRSPAQENRTQEIAEISRSLKALAKELKCPVLALSQLNRQVESRIDKRPNNGDLRDSGALEQDADLIMFIYRDEVYHPNSHDDGVAEIIIGKQRQGPTGTTRLLFDGRYTLFSNHSESSLVKKMRGNNA